MRTFISNDVEGKEFVQCTSVVIIAIVNAFVGLSSCKFTHNGESVPLAVDDKRGEDAISDLWDLKEI